MNVITISLCLLLFINQEFINLFYFSQTYSQSARTHTHALQGHNYDNTNKDTSIC